MTNANLRGEIGVVVPTLGGRPEYLLENLTSLRRAGDCTIVLVRPPAADDIDEHVGEFVDLIVDDPGTGLASAINRGMTAFAPCVRFTTWLGDDDRLTPAALDAARSALVRNGSVLAFGQCQYIDAEGAPLWLNRSGRWAAQLMRVGPQLVPQPGSLFTRDAFESVGGLDEDLRWAFDLDLFLRLGHRGRFTYIDRPLAEFRWHEGSLSVGGREGSVDEASRVRQQAHGPFGRAASRISEPLVRSAIMFAGKRVTARAAASRRAP